jgi:hypothetical protein
VILHLGRRELRFGRSHWHGPGPYPLVETIQGGVIVRLPRTGLSFYVQWWRRQ